MIALVSISTPDFMDVPPLNLLYIGDALKKAGYEVQVFHCPSDQIESWAKKITSKDPLFVGISTFTGNQAKFSVQMSKAIRKLSQAPIVWGGVHPSLIPEQTLSEDYVDYIVMGEGEETIVELAKALEKKKPLKGILGLGYKENNKPHFNGQRPFIRELDKYKADWSLIDIKKYFMKLWDCKKVIKFITSRGCPYNCSFCYNLRFNRRTWRCHSVDFVVSEIQKLKDQHGIDGIGFYDDNFFSNPKRAMEILTRIKLPWEVGTNIKDITRNLLEKFREIECRELFFGLESGSDRVLGLINKSFNSQDMVKGIKMLSEYQDIYISASFLIGLPTETWGEIGETIDMVLKLSEIHPKIGYTIGTYLPYPGTDLYDLAIKKGFKPPERTEDWHILDRWKSSLDPVWIDAEYKHKNAREFLMIRKYSQLLALRHLKMPVVSSIPKWRLENRNFSFPVELALFSWLQHKYADRQSFISKLMHKAVTLYTLNKFKYS